MPEGSLGADAFELSGRVAVRYGNESATGRVQWRHTRDADDLLITNPLGQGVARLTRAGGGYELQTSQGDYHAPDAESLTERVLGWRLPLEGLPRWLRTEARPGSDASISKGSDDRVRELTQDGWRIEFEDYSGGHPSRVRLTRPDLELRLVVDSWQEGP
jgi:outer membrane lipoprotein LolB